MPQVQAVGVVAIHPRLEGEVEAPLPARLGFEPVQHRRGMTAAPEGGPSGEVVDEEMPAVNQVVPGPEAGGSRGLLLARLEDRNQSVPLGPQLAVNAGGEVFGRAHLASQFHHRRVRQPRFSGLEFPQLHAIKLTYTRDG